MARKAKPRPVALPIHVAHFCAECGIRRDGPSLLRHCVAKHQSRLPMVLTVEDAEYRRALAVLDADGKALPR
jgi:hypothetical protein